MMELSSFTLSETWPYWARVTMYLSGAIWIVAYGYMTAFAPKSPETTMEFTEFRQIYQPNQPHGIFYVLTVLNNTGKTVQITELQLEWFSGKIPAGGLSSNAGIDAVYTIANDESGFTVDSGHGALRVRIDKPFANDPYLKAIIPLAERLENEGSSRFLVVFGAELGTFLNNVADLRATLTFSDETKVDRLLAIE